MKWNVGFDIMSDNACMHACIMSDNAAIVYDVSKHNTDHDHVHKHRTLVSELLKHNHRGAAHILVTEAHRKYAQIASYSKALISQPKQKMGFGAFLQLGQMQHSYLVTYTQRESQVLVCRVIQFWPALQPLQSLRWKGGETPWLVNSHSGQVLKKRPTEWGGWWWSQNKGGWVGMKRLGEQRGR